MSNITIESLEDFLLAEDKKTFLDKLVFGTEPYLFFSLLHALHTSDDVSPQVEAQIKEYNQSFGTYNSHNLNIRALLKKFDRSSTTQAEKDKIITELRNQYLHFQFNYSKPADITSSELHSDKKTLPSTLDQNTISLDSQLPKIYNSPHEFHRFSPEALTRVDTSKITGNIQVFENFVFTANPLDFEDFPKLIVELMKQKKWQYNSISHLFSKLTLDQLNELAKLDSGFLSDSEFVHALCRKEFKTSSLSEIGRDLPKQEKRSEVLKLYTWAKQQKTQNQSLISEALYELLQLDLELNNFNKDLFIEYLERPRHSYGNISKEHSKTVSAEQSKRQGSISFVYERISVRDLIRTYLEHFLSQAKDTSAFVKYFDSQYLNEVFYSVKLMQGETVDTKQVLTPEKLKKLAEAKELTILKHNKEYYKASDAVSIDLQVKNVPSLMIKIFEFKSENYYLKTRSELDASINLDGLIAAFEQNVTFSKPPIQRFTNSITLDTLSDKKKGIFIVEFIGNGLSSRAVIRKGKISFIEQQTSAGPVFTLIDEDANVCQGGRVGIWIQDHFYRADANGKILIPFSVSRYGPAILVHNDFAQLTHIDLQQENYDFKCGYIYNNESFLMGNKARILVQPRLFLNGQTANIELMKNCSATITTINEDGIPSKFNFEKLKFSATQETELEFPIPAKLREIQIEVKGQITPMNKKEPVDYSSNMNIPIEANNLHKTFCDLHLRYSSQGYFVYVLGKTGEPKTNVNLSLAFRNRFLSQEIHQTLQTDSEGKVFLGKLEEIIGLTARLNPVGSISEVSKNWSLNNLKSVNYPKDIRICEGDDVVLPLSHKQLNRHLVSFSETLDDGTTRRNLLSTLKVDGHKLIISGLKEGTYNLHLKDVESITTIRVLKGTYWNQNKNFLLANNVLRDIKSDVNNIVITGFKVTPKGDNVHADISIEAYVDDPKLARFHVFGSQFLDANLNRDIDNLDANLPYPQRREVDLKLQASQFLNNRSLGDEYCYVLDRKNQARYLGNTLEKPPVLLKKTFVRDTQTTEENLAEGGQYKAEAQLCMADSAQYLERAAPQKRMMMKGYAGSASRERGIVENGRNSLNFLENACLIHSNLRVNEQGQIILKDFPIHKYANLQIIASNLTSNISKVFPLDDSRIPTKDLSQKARNSESVFSINRTSVNLPTGEKIQIKDLTSTEIQIVDSLPRLFDIQKNLILSRGDSTLGAEFDKWEFLKTWGDLQHEEKLRKYDKFASHELNLFTYFKDRTFFDQVVLPFLHNKIEKTVVDYFFLNDKKRIQEFAAIERFKGLNSLEQALVILGLKPIDEAQAKNLASSLESQNSLRKVDINEFNKYFDTVLTSKKVEDEEKALGGRAEKLLEVGGGGQPRRMMATMARAMPTSSAINQTFGVQKQMAFESRAMMREEECLDEFQAECAYEDDADDFDAEYLERRGAVQAGFQELEKTKEYTERHYYEKVGKTIPIALNSFWVDLAKHWVQKDARQPFLTQNFIFAHSNSTELISALAFLSLPFQPENHKQTTLEGRGLEIRSGSDLVVFTKAVTEAESDLKGEFLITQRFFDPQDMYTESEEEPGLQIEKEVDQYIVDKLYGSTVIVTNSSSSRQQLQVLVEIPEGAIPVRTGDYTKSHNIYLNAFGTQTIEFFFYFPRVGKFKVNPPNASKRGKVVAIGKRFDIEIKKEKTYETLETLTAVLTKGSKDDVLNFTRTKNIWNPKIFNFSSIYWLLVDKEFFGKFIDILRERKHFDQIVWQFGFYHNDTRTIREYFAANPFTTINSYLNHVDSSLIQVDKLTLLEYNPFVNQRVHLLSNSQNRILNVQLKEQYKNYIAYLVERKTLDTEHYLGLVYYLLLQDRVQDAIRFFGKVNREEVRKNHEHELQYDYFAAYLDFFMGYPQFSFAREICQKYLDYPVLSWRSLFIEVANQLAEFDGGEILEDEVTKDTEKRQNRENAQKEESISMEIHGTDIQVTHQNVKEITISFYKIDLEILFSRNPFITQSNDEFSYIQSSNTHTFQVENPDGLKKVSIEVPERLQKFNLYVELKTESKTLSANYFSTSLKVQVFENYGQVRVLDVNDKPLSKTYVKCFAKPKNKETAVFYKDGYTDLRGRFDYATLNSSDISTIEKFAIFVMNDELGSVIKEAKAPSKLSRVEPKLHAFQQFSSKVAQKK